jgi:hypothetical protein
MDISNLQRIADLPRLIRLLAARSASELNLSSLAADAEIPVRTLPPYLDLLETLYLIDRIPAWSTNLSKRVVDRPKVFLLDSGLAARLINVSPTRAEPNANPDAAGAIIEAFVISELRRNSGGLNRHLDCPLSRSRRRRSRPHNGNRRRPYCRDRDQIGGNPPRQRDPLDHQTPRQSRHTLRRRTHPPHRPTSPAIR